MKCKYKISRNELQAMVQYLCRVFHLPEKRKNVLEMNSLKKKKKKKDSLSKF